MTDEDVTSIAGLASGLASFDLEDTRADVIRQRAGDELGHASRRGADVLAAGAFVTGYLVWVLAHVMDVFKA
jgi:hypothetical protein